jgi:hypothetical protein
MEAKNPREGCAALVLGHYYQRRAGVARIRQTWLPTARIRRPDQASQPACVAWGWKCGWPRAPDRLSPAPVRRQLKNLSRNAGRADAEVADCAVTDPRRGSGGCAAGDVGAQVADDEFDSVGDDVRDAVEGQAIRGDVGGLAAIAGRRRDGSAGRRSRACRRRGWCCWRRWSRRGRGRGTARAGCAGGSGPGRRGRA